MSGDNATAVWAAATGLICGWPFAVVALLPLCVHVGLTACVDWAGVAGVLQGRAAPTAALRPQAWALAGHAALAVATIVGAQCLVDKYFYATWLIAPWNIIKYNALGQGGGGQGADLYGVEPPSFYAKNILLNFNVVGLLAACSPLAVALSASRRGHVWDYGVGVVGQLTLWLAAMWPRPHKEERFLFVVYPLFPLAAAFTLCYVESAVAGALSALFVWRRNPLPVARRGVLLAFSACACVLSAMRIVALVDGFSAPFAAWSFVSSHLQARGSSTWPLAVRAVLGVGQGGHGGLPSATGARVCVGKEWYRYPSAFFLPERTRRGAAAFPAGYRYGEGGPATLAFTKSGFGGQLPSPYLPPPLAAATAANRTGVYNDENREEADRYVPVETCDYVVDFQLPVAVEEQAGVVAGYEPYFSPGALLRGGEACACPDGQAHCTAWRSLFSAPFLHADGSPPLSRALYIPGYSPGRNAYGEYHVLRKEVCTNAVQAA